MERKPRSRCRNLNIAQGLNTSINPAIIVNSSHPLSLIAEASCDGPTAGSPSSFWRELITHNGAAVQLGGASFTVFRNVVDDFGADNSGNSDASGAINNAIGNGDRYGNGVTTRPAYVYVPAGTYKISNQVNMLVNTFLVGDPLNMPTFVADSSLGSNPVIQGFDNSAQSTTNFYIGIRNINIDTTSISISITAVGLNWAVSQGCSLFNVNFNMPDSSSHIGITMDAFSTSGDNEGGGSGTLISDCTFTGGAIGIQLSNQQYHFKGLTFNGCNTGVFIDHVFVASFQDITFENCNYGIDMSSSFNIGAISLIDSSISSCNAGIFTAVTGSGEGSIVIDNFNVGGGVTTVLSSSSSSALLTGSVTAGNTWVMGNENPQNFQSGKTYPITRPSALLSGGNYYTKKQPQYETYDISQFVNVKSVSGFTVYGDNVHDDSAAINAILAANANCKIVYFPQGIYKVMSTIVVPPGSRIVGDVYSSISGVGSNFFNDASPIPVVQVGQPGDTGVVEISDMIFTVADVLQGAIILEVNMAGNPGDVSFHNSHLRVGGTADTLVNTNCGGDDTSDCKAAFAMLHVTSSASPYIENMWGWTADHSLDGGPAQNIATGRGALIESTKGAWLVGTAFEHNTLYQYNLNNAQNVFIGMQQTETAYWQGIGTAEQAPQPWAALSQFGDPTFSNCGTTGDSGNAQCFMGFAQHMSSSSNIVIHGSAFWVFFNDMTDGSFSNAGCPNHNNICQENAVFISTTSDLFWYNLLTKSTTNMIFDGGIVTATQVNNPGGWEGSVPGVIAAYLKDSGVASAQ
ncbi:hypothetical protein D0Z07_1901 [Hyphodiscus hymeniophilus]|uniref:Rhamnogalacturonase A/B/Epimerase-like pectate lyase domain-containing protein n=1 Tax=Hyphodiscus hymeniophilus TaxID=353542 RepID=A0A9P6VNM2_9HELO|nr:hypothetical protein D0Z07_1901 [Hyphodiscus hymeniophilus]